jgi:diaminopimelate epimerase
MLTISKAHAYGNDFLYVPASQAGGGDVSALARRLCDRHRGAGGDGLILYTLTEGGARMRLINADGSRAELSGNGLRALAAIVIRAWRSMRDVKPGTEVSIDTEAGTRVLTFLGDEGARVMFRAAMGVPKGLHETAIDAGGERVHASVLSIGNPQCVLLGPLPDEERFRRVGAALEKHPFFPEGTNVEFAELEGADRVRIRIWERGVGPTESSGTGACAAAIAAIAHGGASAALDVVAPGGTQRVEWTDEGIYLTGWAELLWEGTWLADV